MLLPPKSYAPITNRIERWKSLTIFLLTIFFMLTCVIRFVSDSREIQSNRLQETRFAALPLLPGNPNLPAPSVRKRFSDYVYLSDIEFSRYGDFIWFFSFDSLSGPVHSNDRIGVRMTYFTDSVTALRIINPFATTFLRGYREYAELIRWREHAYDLRRAAQSPNGQYFESPQNLFTYGLVFLNNIAMVWCWETGTTPTFDDTTQVFRIVHWSNLPFAIFFEGDLWMKGVVCGKVGVGATGSIRLMDDVKYSDCLSYHQEIPLSCPNYLTVISEAVTPGTPTGRVRGIMIANTFENGREGGATLYPQWPQNYQHRRDIVLHGLYIALNGSFSFEQQNDGTDPYIFNNEIQSEDERGCVFLRGAIAQKRRDYLHRTNEATTGIPTGYQTKIFNYDQRFRENPPPFQPPLSVRTR